MSLATSMLRASLAVAAGSASTGLGYAATVNLLCELELERSVVRGLSFGRVRNDKCDR